MSIFVCKRIPLEAAQTTQKKCTMKFCVASYLGYDFSSQNCDKFIVGR